MTGRDRQTVADVTLMIAGSEEAMFQLARVNGVSLDAEVTGVELLEVPVSDQRVKDFYKLNGIIPANALSE